MVAAVASMLLFTWMLHPQKLITCTDKPQLLITNLNNSWNESVFGATFMLLHIASFNPTESHSSTWKRRVEPCYHKTRILFYHYFEWERNLIWLKSTHWPDLLIKLKQSCVRIHLIHGVFFAHFTQVYHPLPKSFTLSDSRDYIQGLPDSDSPEVFGMHPNAEKSYRESQANKLMSTLMSVQPRVSMSMMGWVVHSKPACIPSFPEVFGTSFSQCRDLVQRDWSKQISTMIDVHH